MLVIVSSNAGIVHEEMKNTLYNVVGSAITINSD